MPREEFDRLIAVNICGVTNVIRHFVPAMVERKSGVIVNFSSGWGAECRREVGPDCVSKFAIEGLTKVLAEELPEGMAAVPLNPGIINTDMLRQAWDDAPLPILHPNHGPSRRAVHPGHFGERQRPLADRRRVRTE